MDILLLLEKELKFMADGSSCLDQNGTTIFSSIKAEDLLVSPIDEDENLKNEKSILLTQQNKRAGINPLRPQQLMLNHACFWQKINLDDDRAVTNLDVKEVNKKCDTKILK